MNALGLVEQESGRAVGFYCGACGRPQLPFHCNEVPTVEALTELHRKAEKCCTTSNCSKHDRILYGWHLCPLCLIEGPSADLAFTKAPPQGPDFHEITAADGTRLTSSNGVAWTPRPKRSRKAAP